VVNDEMALIPDGRHSKIRCAAEQNQTAALQQKLRNMR